MLINLFMAEDKKLALVALLLSIPTVLIALTFHEVAHGYIAYKLGDPTARSLGRLTLNPLKHIDPFGALAMLVVGFGWANPVPINTRYFKNPRKGMALSALAGPVTNILLGLFGAICYALIIKFNLILSTAGYVAALFFLYFLILNINLAVFNLIPVPPFDGSRILFAFLPDRMYFGIMKYERIIMMVVLIGFATGVLDISWLTDYIIDGILRLVALIL